MIMKSALPSILAVVGVIVTAKPATAGQRMRVLSDEEMGDLEFGADESMSLSVKSQIAPSDEELHGVWGGWGEWSSSKSAKNEGSAKSSKSGEYYDGEYYGEWSSSKSAKNEGSAKAGKGEGYMGATTDEYYEGEYYEGEYYGKAGKGEGGGSAKSSKSGEYYDGEYYGEWSSSKSAKNEGSAKSGKGEGYMGATADTDIAGSEVVQTVTDDVTQLAAALADVDVDSFIELFATALEKSNIAFPGSFGNLPSASNAEAHDEYYQSKSPKASKSWVCGWDDSAAPVGAGSDDYYEYYGKSSKSKGSK